MKYGLFLLYVLILALGCKTDSATVTPLLNFIPENASMVIKINDLTAFKNSLRANDFFKETSATKINRSVLKKVKYLDYLASGSKSVLVFTEANESVFEFVLITTETPEPFQLKDIKNVVIDRIDFEDVTFDRYQIDNETFYALKSKGRTIVSSSRRLLQKFDGDKIEPTQPETLQKIYQTSNNTKAANIFINLNNSDVLLSSILSDTSKMSISGFSDWISLDLNITEKKLNLSGISIANDSTWNFVDLFANTAPIANSTPSFAPLNADAILSYTFDNYQTFAKNRQSYANLSSPIDQLFNNVEEIGFIYLNSKKVILLNTYGSESIYEYLKKITKRTWDFQGSEIIELRKTDFLNTTFSPVIKDYHANFCVVIQNAFVFSEEKAILQTIISNHKNGNTFNKSSLYTTANKELAKESTILFISNTKNIDKILKDDFKVDFYNDFKKATLSSYTFGTQIITDKNFYHTNIVIQETEGVEGSGGIDPFFSVQLDAALATNPQFVTNHTTHKKEIVVQDQNNQLYLISGKGKILWKKQLQGKIQGKIKQVDIFKNGRLQLTFTTNDQLITLDRNGKEVKHLTKSFDGGNLNPLAVFDYEGTKNYRFVVAQGEKIFMYNSKGEIVDGFKYKKAEKAVTGTPKHIVIGSKDFLVFKLQNGSLKILNRVGDVRTNVHEKIDFSENEVYRYKKRFVVTDKKGALYQIDTKGKTAKTNFNLSNDHGMTATENTLVMMNDNILTIKGKQVELELGVYTPPKIFYLYDKIYISVTDIQNQRIYLFDSQAKSIPGFPVFGTSILDLADIENDKKLELVTRDRDSTLITYKLN
ncbi:FIG00649225: hypothetical protein [hydrothermal vent metagenome]|uniref:Uncharacterized protein n=1 Tax=hydrothermal vent metagenome TaxID=652676 RepID=A0A3B0TQD8_9ZZZZ